ncbi:unnamed protein product [Zymoseptoria tritici ST99CH_3D1]|uniref:Bromo domain-containing protein n=1 Tax=Zymoseptoria tritici (strain ST99CH_3D7) TaxID=1276538 RepID=A0A1X7RFE1_ZYMT9|nr:unnamed protein product [Zymoseptoria tritici ST99CH_3D7]SMR44647.1 unnamed protein product [Zymoseptoria tritici ST99CH_3D1]
MSSEAAHPELVNGASSSDAPVTNGDHQHQQQDTMSSDQGANTTAFEDNSALPVDQIEVTQDSQPTSLKPVEDVASGITSVADFLPNPKDAPTSHPTPPPDEPLVSSDANVDVEMTEAEDRNVEVESAPEGLSEVAPTLVDESVPVPAPVVESSLVRPREEDDGEEAEEPAAKRSRFDGVDASAAEDASLPIANANDPEPELEPQQEQTAIFTDVATPVETSSADPLLSGDAASEPHSSIPPAAPSDILPPADSAAPESQASIPQAPPSEVPPSSSAALEPEASTSQAALPEVPPPLPSTSINGTSAEADAQPTIESIEAQPPPSIENAADAPMESSQPSTQALPTSIPPPAAPSSSSAAPAQATAQYDTKPMTALQKTFLQDKMKNLKKTKNSGPFSSPVDYVALGIPSYPEVIKQPMDLGTMDQKLKAGQYATVQEFADDFDLIVNNTRTFNGSAHAITQMAMAMEAYFRRMMESVPSADIAALPKKKASPKPATNIAQRREPRAVPPPVPATESFALQSNGTPQIRRESGANRPARAIKPPPPKEVAYAMPKRKEHQLELKFAEHVLQQIRGPQYGAQNSVFLAPVDPVALNIPNYRQIIKHPMDLGTMTQKMKQGLYGKASEVKKDFDLMIENCISFNPVGNPVRDMGIALQRSFESLWRDKDKWEKKERANSKRGESSAEEESEEEEEEEEDDGDEKSQAIRALQKQLADMQNALAGLNAPPTKKTKKTKAPKQGGTKKSGGASTKTKLPAAKTSKPPKKTKIVTYEEKQEISEAVGNMDGAQVEQLTNIITSNCKKYAEQDEMELEIDDLPNEVQALLLAYVRSIFGNPRARQRQISPDDAGGVMDEDDEFEPSERGKRGGAGGKRKKHRPMGKKEQQDAISNIQKQLAQFQGPANGGQSVGGGYVVPKQEDEDSSGDEESEESEEE